MFFCEWYSFRKSNDDASEHVPKLSMSLRKNSYKLHHYLSLILTHINNTNDSFNNQSNSYENIILTYILAK